MRDLIAGVLLLSCLFVTLVSLFALIKPLPQLKIPTRGAALRGLGLGLILFIATAIVIPAPKNDVGSEVGAQLAVVEPKAAPVDTKPQPVVTAPLLPELTGPQRNAVRSAKQYLQMSGYSRDGLIGQLSSEYGEGYIYEDAVAAVDSLVVDWNEEAAQSAKQYLSMSGYSCKGLIDQLSSQYGEKFTKAQATYGAEQAGAC